MKHREKRVYEKEVLTAITCDVCGTYYDNRVRYEPEIGEFTSIDYVGGYNSIFGDMNRVQCDICQRCLKELIGQYCRIEEDTNAFLSI